MKEDEKTQPDLHKHLIFVMKKKNSAESGFEFILYNQTDICPLPTA